MDELSISVLVADRPYKLVVEKDYEELFRKAAKLIDKKIKEYSSNYAFKDKQDLLAMVALDYTTALLQAERRNSESDDYLAKKLLDLDKAMTEVLKVPVA
jgi:cell division protein ZapA (FtsZ GTPase activity inhibitor)